MWTGIDAKYCLHGAFYGYVFWWYCWAGGNEDFEDKVSQKEERAPGHGVLEGIGWQWLAPVSCCHVCCGGQQVL